MKKWLSENATAVGVIGGLVGIAGTIFGFVPGLVGRFQSDLTVTYEVINDPLPKEIIGFNRSFMHEDGQLNAIISKAESRGPVGKEKNELQDARSYVSSMKDGPWLRCSLVRLRVTNNSGNLINDGRIKLDSISGPWLINLTANFMSRQEVVNLKKRIQPDSEGRNLILPLDKLPSNSTIQYDVFCEFAQPEVFVSGAGHRSSVHEVEKMQSGFGSFLFNHPELLSLLVIFCGFFLFTRRNPGQRSSPNPNEENESQPA